MSLKKNANELNSEFSSINDKVNNLDKSLKITVDSSNDSTDIDNILSTFQSSPKTNAYRLDTNSLHSDANRRLSTMSSNVDTASEVSYSSDESSDDSDDYDDDYVTEDKQMNEKCNKIIKMLLNNSNQIQF